MFDPYSVYQEVYHASSQYSGNKMENGDYESFYSKFNLFFREIITVLLL